MKVSLHYNGKYTLVRYFTLLTTYTASLVYSVMATPYSGVQINSTCQGARHKVVTLIVRDKDRLFKD